MRPTRPTDEHLARLSRDGLSTRQMAERLGVCNSTVRGWLKDAGLPVRRAAHRTIGAWGDGAACHAPMPGRLRPRASRMGG